MKLTRTHTKPKKPSVKAPASARAQAVALLALVLRDRLTVDEAVAKAPLSGAEVFNARGPAVHMREIVAAIEACKPAARGQITFEDRQLALPSDVDDSRLRAALGGVPETPLEQGVAQTIAIFEQASAAGRLS